MKYLDEHFYHVFNRGSRSEEIFFSDANYEYFLRLIAMNASTHLVYIGAYCLMPNHYHLVLQQKENGSISKFIQSAMTSYVQAINKKYDTSGSLFQGKAKSKLIDSDENVLQVIRYVHLNPVSAKLVQAPEDWRFSDYREWIDDTFPTPSRDRKGTTLTSTSYRIGNLRNAYFANAEEYRQFVEEYRIEKQNCKLEKFLFEEE
ncbi:MAG: transposase [Ignavibacteriales bacterium]|nr:transposase [Ignavibacteriales bacterium]